MKITKKKIIPVFLNIEVTPETVLLKIDGISTQANTLSYNTHLSILNVVSREVTIFWSFVWYSSESAIICWIFELIIHDISQKIRKYVKSERKNESTLGSHFFWKNPLSESIANESSTAIIKGIIIPAPI